MRNLIYVISFLFCLSANVQDQRQLVSNFGGTLVGDEYILSFAIGEGAVEPFYSDDVILNPGFYQGHALITAVSQNEIENRLLVFPNPFQNELDFAVDNELFAGRLQIILSNTLGQILQQSSIDASTLNAYTLNTRFG